MVASTSHFTPQSVRSDEESNSEAGEGGEETATAKSRPAEVVEATDGRTQTALESVLTSLLRFMRTTNVLLPQAMCS